MTTQGDSSPLPRLTVNIGIVGHRNISPACEPLLRQRVSSFLRLVMEQVQGFLQQEGVRSLVSELYAPQPPRFVLLSPLAEGADTLAAEEALALGYELHVPLPMAREEYEKDFESPESLATFRRLLAEAGEAHIFEIRACNPERGHAYADAAAVTLNHSDLLLALWDGKETGYIAGTAPTIELATRQHIPVIHLHIDGISPTCIISDGESYPDWQERLRKQLYTLLLPVEALSDESNLRFARACARQKPVSENDWFFRYLGLPGLFFRSEKALGNFLRQVGPRPAPAEQVPNIPGGDAFPRRNPGNLARLRELFTCFDHFSNAYSVRYRSGLFWRYLAPVIAVIFLASALNWKIWFSEWDEFSLTLWTAVWFALQAIFLLTPLVLQYLDRRNMWHRKFFSYRVVGEQLRQTMHLGALGFITVRSKESTYTESPQRWTAWYYRALMRHEGLPGVTLDERYLLDWLAWTRNDFVVDQLNYHARRWRREGNMRRKLVLLGILMFALGILAALGRGTLTVAEGPVLYKSIASALTLVFPSLAVFFAGFCAYACYAKDQQVSLIITHALKAICREMDSFLRAAGYDMPQHTGDEVHDPLPRPLHFTHACKLAALVDECCKGELLGGEELSSTKGIKGH